MLGKLMPSRIKPLIIAAVLLLLSASASFALFGSNMIMSTSVAPTASGGGGGGSVACALGPAAPSVPANASLGNYGKCLFYADFKNAASGSFWQNPNNFVVNCGSTGNSVAGNPSKWYFTFATLWATGGSYATLPCNQSTINTDPTFGQELKLFGAANTAGISFNWPSTLTSSGPLLSAGYYTRITFRTDCNTIYQNGGACNIGGPDGEIALWSTSGAGNGSNNWVDENEWETLWGPVGGTTLTGFGWCPSIGIHDASHNGNSTTTLICWGPGANGPTINMTQPHTIEALWTNDGSSSVVECVWVDGAFPNGCVNSGPPSPVGITFTDQTRSIFLNAGKCCGGGTSPPPAPDAMTFWVDSWEVWACSTVGSSVCKGTTFVNGGTSAPSYWH